MDSHSDEEREVFDKEVEHRILRQIGKAVRFTYPGSEGKRAGVLKDRVVWRSDTTSTGVRYWDVIDLIEFPDEVKPLWIRFSYYREDRGRLRWAGQTSLAEPVENMRQLLVKGAADASWFREILPGLV